MSISTGDEVVTNIENFLKEYNTDIPKIPSLNENTVCKTNAELIQILDSNSQKMPKMVKISENTSTEVRNNKGTVSTSIISRKRNAINFLQTPNVRIEKLQIEPKRKGRPKKVRLHMAMETDYFPKLKRCEELKFKCPYKRKATSTRHFCKAKVRPVNIRNDSETIKTVIVKEEIIDLTFDEESIYMNLKFAKISTLEEEQCCKIIDLGEAKVEIKIHGDYINEVQCFNPNIEIHIEPVIDLTECEDENLTPVSEKECASRILQIIFSCHKLLDVNKKLQDTFAEIEKCLTLVNDDSSWDATFKNITKNASSLGYSLLEILSDIFVKNLNFERFLEIISSKISLSYGVDIQAEEICSLLFWMLGPIQNKCGSKLSQEILQKTTEFIDGRQIKQEAPSGEVITSEQLKVLEQQINQYIEIFGRQDTWTDVHDWISDSGFSDITKDIKEEILIEETMCE